MILFGMVDYVLSGGFGIAKHALFVVECGQVDVDHLGMVPDTNSEPSGRGNPIFHSLVDGITDIPEQ